MRAVILAFVVEVALTAGSAQAAPLPPKPGIIEFDTVPSVELVRDGCGRGWTMSEPTFSLACCSVVYDHLSRAPDPRRR
jgi:hypothetical protein